MSDRSVHPFEASGLGKAPFRYLGMSEKVLTGQPNDRGFIVGYAGQPAGTCDHCGTGIRYCCHVRSADGKEFIVGTDCVLKLDRKTNTFVDDVEREKKAIISKQNRARRAVKVEAEKARIAQAFADYAADPGKQSRVAAVPHPVIAGKTMVDYIEWMRRNAGHTGLFKIAKYLEKI